LSEFTRSAEAAARNWRFEPFAHESTLDIAFQLPIRSNNHHLPAGRPTAVCGSTRFGWFEADAGVERDAGAGGRRSRHFHAWYRGGPTTDGCAALAGCCTRPEVARTARDARLSRAARGHSQFGVRGPRTRDRHGRSSARGARAKFAPRTSLTPPAFHSGYPSCFPPISGKGLLGREAV
jgi:hypothetical protein